MRSPRIRCTYYHVGPDLGPGDYVMWGCSDPATHKVKLINHDRHEDEPSRTCDLMCKEHAAQVVAETSLETVIRTYSFRTV